MPLQPLAFKTVEAVLAIQALGKDPSIAQHAEMVRTGRLGDRQGEAPAGVLLSIGHLRDYPQADWITQGVQDVRESQLILAHAGSVSYARLEGLGGNRRHGGNNSTRIIERCGTVR